MKVGFIGLGGMGRPIAARILEAGFDLAVTDIRNEPVHDLAQRGARTAGSAREIAAGSDIVLASLPTNEASEQVGAEVVSEAAPGAIFVDLSTITPAVIREVAERGARKGVGVLDAPVSGGIEQRENGTLAVMVGGDDALVERVRPVLEAFGGSIFHVGPVGAGTTAKLINNLTLAANSIAAIEAMVLGAKAGLSLDKLIEVISASSGDSRIFRMLSSQILTKSYEPGPSGPRQGFRTMVKDTRLATEFAKDLSVPLLAGAAALQAFTAGDARGLGDKEMWALVEVFEEFAQVRVRPPEL